jgi:hypothetical protein
VSDKYRKGLQKYTEGMGPPPAPLPGKSGPSGISNMIIFVEVSHIFVIFQQCTHRDKVLTLRLDGRNQPTFKPLAGEYSGTMEYKDFQVAVCEHVDGWGSKQFPPLRFRDPYVPIQCSSVLADD